jgi:tetratricopeptide (TPR) repeat protein
MRLFRQQSPETWQDVFDRLVAALRGRLREHRRSDQLSAGGEHGSQELEEFLKAGAQLVRERRFAEAEDLFRRSVESRPDHSPSHQNLGAVLAMQRKFEEAVVQFRRAIQLNPAQGDAHANLGLALLECGRAEEAVAAIGKALSLGHNADTRNNLGVALMRCGRPAEALEAYRQAVRMRPDYPEGRCNFGHALLQLGKWKEGWQEFEWRWKCGDVVPRTFDRPRWVGDPLGRRRLLLFAEQGLGDTLQFVRFISSIKQGGEIYLECQPALVPLLSWCSEIDRLIPAGAPLPDFDVHAPLMSVPALVGCELSTLPREVPYLEVDPQSVRGWGERLAHIDAFRIGIAWQGNPGYSGDADRSIALRHFAPLAEVPHVRLINLQKGPGMDQLADPDVTFPIHFLGHDVDEAGAFVDTAAVMRNLDLVITSDSAVAHLAGALGIPVWIVLPLSADWRWLWDRDDCPWYPTARLFRQTRAGDWSEPFRRIARALQEKSLLHSFRNRRGAGAEPRSEAESASSDADRFMQAGISAMQRDDLWDAERQFQKALEFEPESASALNNLGVVRAKLGRVEEAQAAFRRAWELDPTFAEAAGNLGLGLLQCQKYADAEVPLRAAVELRKGHPDDLNHLGLALVHTDRGEEAVPHFERALEIRPRFAAACTNLADTLMKLKRGGEAAALYRRAVECEPGVAEHYNALGNALTDLGRMPEAVTVFRKALELRPDYVDALNNLGVVLGDLNRLDEALDALQRALYIRPEALGTHRNLAIVLLLQGAMERGWAEYEWRNQEPFARRFSQPRWDGNPGRGRIFIHSEQGLGDAIQFIRYVRMIKALGWHTIVECRSPLRNLFQSVEGIDELVSGGDVIPPFDVQAPLMSLPSLFRTNEKTIPPAVDFLGSEPELIRRWGDRLREIPGFRVGIFWQGNPDYGGDHHRSIPLRCFEALADVPGVTLISLQKEHGRDQLPASADRLGIVDLADELTDFCDTAAVVGQLDLVIGCDSSPAHLAASVGTPTWIPLSLACDWRWMRNRDDSPWYPSVRLFRQSQWKEWDDVFQRIASELSSLCSNRLRQPPQS